MFLLPSENLQRKEKKNGVILYALNSPVLNSHVNNKTSFVFLFYYKSIKNIKQNIGELLYRVGFTKPALKSCD